MFVLNDKAPDFSLQGDNGELYQLSDHAGQLCEYRDGIEAFAD